MPRSRKTTTPPTTERISFSSEALLQQAIAVLLTRMPDVSGVQILQGALELGKDIIFYTHGGFAEQMLCACVIKNAKITGEVWRSQGARTVYLQAQQAFDSPHISEEGREIYVERVYIVTPFEISASAIQSIRGQLKDRPGQIVFIGRAKLFDLLKQYWPDYLADEADALEHHLARLDETLDEEHPLPGLASRFNLGSIEGHVKTIYVPQSFNLVIRTYKLSIKATEFTLDHEWPATDLTRNEGLNNRRKLQEFTKTIKPLEEMALSLQLEEKEAIDNIEYYVGEILAKLEIISDKHTRSYNSPEMVLLISRFNEEKQGLASRLMSSLVDLNRSMSSVVKVTPEVFNSESFRTYRMFDNWAYWAPPGLFDISSKRIQVSKDILDKWHGSLLITGAPGFGKTSFCRWHALQDTDRFNAGKSNFLPVYVPLHKLVRTQIGSFAETFLGNLGKSVLLASGSWQEKVPKAARVRLYLDGLDEIPSEEQRREVMQLAEIGTKGDDSYQVIVTARDHVHGSWLNWLTRVSLSTFDDEDVASFVTGWLGKQTEQAESFYRQLRATSGLAALMRIPLLATLIILVFRQTRKLPESKLELYEMFIDLLSGGWDTAKGILRTTRFSQRVKLMVLTSLASATHEKERREFQNDELRAAIQVRSKSLSEDWKSLRDELIEDGLIIESGKVMQFSHLSFQEFLTAKDYISDTEPTRIGHVLSAFFMGKDWYKEVLEFYVGLSGKPRDTTRWIVSRFDRNAYTYGSPGRQRLEELITSVTESFPEFTIAEVYSSTPTEPRRSLG